MDSKTYTYFSICEIRLGGAALEANHGPADHWFYILSGKGYSLMNGKRYEFKVGDLMWTPGNCKHEMYPLGTTTLKFLVSLHPVGFEKQTEPYVKSLYDIKPEKRPEYKNASIFPLATPAITGGAGTCEFYVVEFAPDGSVVGAPTGSDQMTYVISGAGYAVVDGEKFPLTAEDGLYVPKNQKWEIHAEGGQALRLCQTFSPAR
jgi:mannose-6-phosphate isomerase-like protein (cupin superfamily)